MYDEEKAEITALENKISDLRGKAGRENRQLYGFERALMDEMEKEARNIKLRLPLNAPETLSFGNQGGGFHSGQKVFESLGEQLQSVRYAGSPGRQTDQRLYQVRGTGLNETIPSEGGFLLQQDFSNTLLVLLLETGKLAKLCRRIPISSNSNSIKINGFDETSRVSGSRFGGVESFWIAEEAEKEKSHPKFRQINLTLKKLIGLCYASDELIEDTAALGAVISTAFVSEFNFQIDNVIVNGIGGGQPLGILPSGCLVVVPKETGQKAFTVVAEGIFKMYSRLLPGSEASAVWLINKNVTQQLFQLNLAVGTGGIPVYMPANSVAGVPYQTLLGLPVISIEQAATLGYCGDIILADLKNGYILAEKGGIKQDVSIHVDFILDRSVFRFVLRIDGCPTLSAPVIPYKGSSTLDTQSFFVALADRIV